MKAKNLLFPFLLVLSICLLSSIVTFADERKDPQLRRCKEQCQHQHPHERERRECKQSCQERYQHWEERERSRRGERDREDPSERLEECRQRCQKREQEQGERRSCEQRCEEQAREERERRQRGGEGNSWREEEEEEGEQQGKGNPYFFDRQSYSYGVKTQHGHSKLSQRFSEKSDLLRGIDNYRVATLDANPNTFVLPHHGDAEAILFVSKGKGKITFLLSEDSKQSHEIRRGDVMRIPAGTTVHLINDNNDEKLQIVKIIKAISPSGRPKEFFGAGGENPESFFNSFSNDVLEAALNVPKEKLERVFRQQRKGAIIKVSQEQIRRMSRESSSEGGKWPFAAVDSNKPFNLLKKRPSYSNNHGQMYEIDGNDNKDLRKLDLEVAFANISAGSMIAPYYNSRTTKVVYVTEGRGYFEMACPHMKGESSRWREREEGRGRGRRGEREEEEMERGWGRRGESQEEEVERRRVGRRGESEEEEEEEEEERGQQGKAGIQYKKVKARISPGTAFVIPAGHPVVTVASRDENLQLISFGINAEDNQKYFLAGKNNILKQLEREAKELSFNVPAREVDEVFNSQREAVFLRGPEQRQERESEGRGGKGAVEAIKAVVDSVVF